MPGYLGVADFSRYDYGKNRQQSKSWKDQKENGIYKKPATAGFPDCQKDYIVELNKLLKQEIIKKTGYSISMPVKNKHLIPAGILEKINHSNIEWPITETLAVIAEEWWNSYYWVNPPIEYKNEKWSKVINSATKEAYINHFVDMFIMGLENFFE